MKRNTVYSLVVFFICFFWVASGTAVQIAMGVLPSNNASSLLSMALFFGAFFASVYYFLFEVLWNKFINKIQNNSHYKPSGVFIAIAFLLVASISIYSGIQSYSVGKLQIEAKKASQERIEREKQRLAALTPEERDAEAKLKAEQQKAAAEAATKQAQAQAAIEAKENADKAKRDLQINLAGAMAKLLKNSMKDPESFELKSLVVPPNGTACYEYRATNSFNAHLAGAAVLTTKGKFLIQEKDGNAFVAVWNKECTSAGGDDITEVVKRFLL